MLGGRVLTIAAASANRYIALALALASCRIYFMINVNVLGACAKSLGACTFAGWALTEGQHRPKAGKKKKTREAGLFFLVPTSY